MTALTNPATYLYLNPILQASKLAIDVEMAVDLWSSSAYARSLPTTLPSLPDDFDPMVYLAENRDIIDVSTMNQVIFEALSNEGRDVCTTARQASYHGTIFRPATLTGTNTFLFDDPTYLLSACNMSIHDQVKISVNSNQEHIYGSVVQINSTNNGFTIKPANNASYTDSSATYLVYGLRIYDAERLALVNLAVSYEQLVSHPQPNQPAYVPPVLEKEFNIDLYHVLYPDTRMLSLNEAYVDYTDNWGAASYRITKASDILNIRCPDTSMMYVTVEDTLRVGKPPSLMVADALTGVVALSGRLVGPSLYIGGCNLVADCMHVAVGNNFTAGSNALSVNNRSIIASVPGLFASNVVMGAEFVVKGDVKLQGDALLVSGETAFGGKVLLDTVLRVDGDASFTSNVAVSQGLAVQDDSSANRLLAWSAIGIGSTRGSVPPSSFTGVGGLSPAPDPIIVGTLIAESTVYVGSGPWMFTDTKASSSALTIQHPSMGLNSHVFDSSGHIGINVAGYGATALEYALVTDGDIYTTGSVISQSDRRFKSDLRVIDSPMERLSALNGYTYSAGSNSQKRCTGVVAQEVFEVLPEAVHVDSDGVMSVAYGNLAGVFIEALKELREEVRALRHHTQSTIISSDLP